MSFVDVSVVIATRNRVGDLCETLSQLLAFDWVQPGRIFVVDNASADDTVRRVRAEFPGVRLIERSTNGGPVAKNDGLDLVETNYVLFLDDDSVPRPGSVERSRDYFEKDSQLGAVGFDAVLPTGAHECNAYPGVFIGCGAMLRMKAVRQVGGLPWDFFMQAEEYDLTLRLMDAGWGVVLRRECVVDHRKTPVSRQSDRTARLDVRNNLLLIARRMPMELVPELAIGWMTRYFWMLRDNGQLKSFVLGLTEGLVRGAWALVTPFGLGGRRAVSMKTAERFLLSREIRLALGRTTARVLILGLGKNAVGVIREARRQGVEVMAVVDEKTSGIAGRKFMGVPVLGEAAGLKLVAERNVDGATIAAVIGHGSWVLAEKTKQHWTRLLAVPVLDALDYMESVGAEFTGAEFTGDKLTGADRAEAESRRTVARSASRAA